MLKSTECICCVYTYVIHTFIFITLVCVGNSQISERLNHCQWLFLGAELEWGPSGKVITSICKFLHTNFRNASFIPAIEDEEGELRRGGNNKEVDKGVKL